MTTAELRKLLASLTERHPMPWRWEEPFKLWMRPKSSYVEDAHHPRSEGGIKDANDNEVLHLGDSEPYENACGEAWLYEPHLVQILNALPALLAVVEAATWYRQHDRCAKAGDNLDAALKALAALTPPAGC